MATIPLTQRGAEKLKDELQRLKTVERHAVIQAIAEARAQGDLSENAEYDAAKDKQGFIEGRILEIESKLAAAQIIDPATLDADGRVVFGATVDLEDEDSGAAGHLPDRRRRRGRPEAGPDLDQLADRARADRQGSRRRRRGAGAGRHQAATRSSASATSEGGALRPRRRPGWPASGRAAARRRPRRRAGAVPLLPRADAGRSPALFRSTPRRLASAPSFCLPASAPRAGGARASARADLRWRAAASSPATRVSR